MYLLVQHPDSISESTLASLQIIGNHSSVFLSPAGELHSCQYTYPGAPRRMGMFCMNFGISWQTSDTPVLLVFLNTWTFILLGSGKSWNSPWLLFGFSCQICIESLSEKKRSVCAWDSSNGMTRGAKAQSWSITTLEALKYLYAAAQPEKLLGLLKSFQWAEPKAIF